MFRRRLLILLGVFLAVLCGLLARAGVLQLVRGDAYRTMAEESMVSIRTTAGIRGRILDRNGVILAEDRACYDLCIDYRFMTAQPRWIRRQLRTIAQQIGVDLDTDTGKAKARAVYDARTAETWVLLERMGAAMGVDVDQRRRRIQYSVERIHRAVGKTVREEHSSHVLVGALDDSIAREVLLLGEISGISLVPSHRRYYPFGDIACHIIGGIGPVFREEMARHNHRPDELSWLERMRRNYRPGDRIGKTGVEAMSEKTLRPLRGYQRFEQISKLVEEVLPRDGSDVRLSIDIELQQRLTEVMKSHQHTGALVVLDVKTGDVLAMVSYPTYDLNTYRTDYPKLSRDVVGLPLLHRAVSACYAPGSTGKPITGLAAVGCGKITPHTLITCTGKNPHTRSGQPHCWIWRSYRSTHGEQDLVDALKHSCNSYFVEAAHRVGGPELTRWFGYFGFGQKPGTGLHEERSGTLGNEAYLRRMHGRGFYPSDAWNMSIGQGIFAASVLQLANAHATIARDGVFLSPKLVEGVRQARRELPLSAEALRAVREGMYKVVNESGGTAYKIFRHADLPVEICGKTGTAQVPPMRADLDGDGEKEIVRTGNHAWFAGFAPHNHPKIAFAILCEYAGSGGKNAGPVAADIIRVCSQMGYFPGGGR